MKKLSLILAAGMLCGGYAFAHDMKGMKESGEAGKAVMVKGEILDLACYMGHGAEGAKHAMCAKQCIKGGAPMGLKTETGEIWLLINDHNAEKAYSEAKNLAGGMATITGHEAKKGGLQGLIVEKAEKAS